VIGDGDHVELSRPAIEVDRVAKAETPVAPAGVHVEVAQQKRFISRHG
jgi:hypothetical protein